ncbi:MAG TPA: tetratricopeptide repeat protein, partial [Vicinamibacterales bacterium]|nr:tetratricopeptide repeat protein [Vicinamibacterales bacterium]
ELIRGGRGVDRPAYFEAMTYNLVRGWAPLRGVLEGRTKYVNLPIPELYDLATDPREERNIASDQHARVATLAGVLQTFDVALPHRPGLESAAAAAALRSLGYVSGSAPARDRYTEADDPKRLVEIDRALQRATILFQEGENGDAIALLDTVIARRADTADAYLTLAQAYWEAGRPEPAIETLERGLANGAPDHDIRIWLGIYLAESGTDSHRAIALLGGMPEDDVEALNGLGVAYSGAERYDDAIRTFERVLALDPTNGLALQNLASMVLRQALASGSETDRRSRMEQAETYARQALDTDPALPDAHTTLGVILSGTGRKGEAIESWKRAVALDGAQFNALYNLWFELAAAGRRDEAVVYGRRFVEAAPPAFFKADLERIRRYLGGA